MAYIIEKEMISGRGADVVVWFGLVLVMMVDLERHLHSNDICT